MSRYAAFLGHQPHLSLAELAVTVPGFARPRTAHQTVVLFDTSAELPANFLQNLGGTVLLAEELSQPIKSLTEIASALPDLIKNIKGKVTFGLRTVGLSPREVQHLYRHCKDHVRKDRPVRYLGNQRDPAAIAALRDHGILDRTGGVEICVIRERDLLWVGVTHSAQDIDAYTHRDMKKPVRDTTVGLLPPKLAQVMINFGVWLSHNQNAPTPVAAKSKKTKASTATFTVFDPFCGTGVIPMECLLRGYSVLASDSSEKAVMGCKKNLDWIRKHATILKTELPSTVWKQDARKAFDLKELPSVVVTETSLGPNLRSRPTVKEIAGLKADSELLQAKFLENAAASLPGVPLVCTWPVWYGSKRPIFLEKIWDTVAKLGYRPALPPGLSPRDGRFSLLYRRPEQFVGREIVLLEPRNR